MLHYPMHLQMYGRRSRSMLISPFVTAAGQVTASALVMAPIALIIDGPLNIAEPSAHGCARSGFWKGDSTAPSTKTRRLGPEFKPKSKLEANHLRINSLQSSQRVCSLGNRATYNEVVGTCVEGIAGSHDALLVAFVGG
ncbi:MAG: hypothetical protein ACI92B_002778 [Marinobacter maritimus]